MKGDHVGELEELVLLAVRAQRDEAYGVTVQQTIETTANRRVTLGAIYSALERLERKGHLASRIGGAETRQGGRRKRLFRLSDTGLDVLRRAHDARAALWGLAETGDG
jgi:DNA-binding PadR family transcriptional regulator